MPTELPFNLDLVHDLRACLPDLSFMPEADSVIVLDDLLASYLDYYGIDFREDSFHRIGRVILPPYTIAVNYWLPDKSPTIPDNGMVMLLHGYFDHTGLFGPLIRYLLGRGYGVICFDLPGHGLSSGERASITSFDQYVNVFEGLLEKVRVGFSGRISAIGQSTGGAILLKHLALANEQEKPLVLDKVTLLAPLVEPAMWWFNKWVYKMAHTRLKGVRRKFRKNSKDQAFLDFIKKDPLQAKLMPMPWLGAMKRWVNECRTMKPSPYPVTILQGKKDTTLAWRFNIRLLRKKFPKANIVLLDNVQHHMANEISPIREEIYGKMGF